MPHTLSTLTHTHSDTCTITIAIACGGSAWLWVSVWVLGMGRGLLAVARPLFLSLFLSFLVVGLERFILSARWVVVARRRRRRRLSSDSKWYGDNLYNTNTHRAESSEERRVQLVSRTHYLLGSAVRCLWRGVSSHHWSLIVHSHLTRCLYRAFNISVDYACQHFRFRFWFINQNRIRTIWLFRFVYWRSYMHILSGFGRISQLFHRFTIINTIL